MKRFMLLSAILVLTGVRSFSQDKKITKTGKIVFEASVPSFEEVKAQNESVTCVVNIKTGEIASLALMRGFRFKVALMEEHFNENYMESDKYPKATFKGKIQGFNWALVGSSPKEFKMKGILEVHGKSKEITTSVFLRKVDNNLEIVSDFNVSIKDFNIEIPKVISMKVAETVNIKTLFLVK